MTQQEQIDKLYRLRHENPEAEIHVCVASQELVVDDSYAWTVHEIRRVELGWWAFDDDQFFTGVEEYYEHLHDFLELDVSEEEVAAKMSRAIIIYTGA